MEFTIDSQSPTVTASNLEFFSSFEIGVDNPAVSTVCYAEIEIPDSFWQGLRDCDTGRVVDMDRAMSETPPDAD